MVSCSFDKNFYTPENRKQLERMLDLAVLPKKGRLREEEKAVESSDEFVQGRRKHPDVELLLQRLLCLTAGSFGPSSR